MTAKKPSATPATTATTATPGPRLSDLSPEWRALISALASGSAQLLLRLAALEVGERIGPDAARAYAGWVARVATTLDALPKE